MKQFLFIYIFLSVVFVKAQNNIKGNFSPAKDYSWLIAYRLKPGTQVYVADTGIKEGEFSLKLPENSIAGTYRLVYAIPQEEFYFDVIYNGEEDIELNFNSDEGVNFISSKENILFNSYFKEINAVQSELISYYSNAATNVDDFKKITNKYQERQQFYEKKSAGLIANQVITANKPYIPSNYETVENYIQNRKNSYFTEIDFKNPVLQASGFLTDKLTNYVLTALPLEQLEKEETEKEIQGNISRVIENLDGVSDSYSFHLLYTLWTQIIASGYQDTGDFIFQNHLKSSPLAAENQEIIDKIEIYNRLRIGAVAPEITWKLEDKNINLSDLKSAKNYILVFWSSTCGHCLKELPALHKELKESSAVKVIAVGLENDTISWNIESAKLDDFHHAIALGKWESDYANLYDIQSTPSYFILDTDKKIIAKPETDKEVIEYLKN